jgi:hypothetical protein
VTGQDTALDTLLPKAYAWATVLVSPAWWRLPGEDRYAHRSGVELAFWTNRQARRSGLCTSCWMNESAPDIRYREGGQCLNFTRLLQLLA